MRDWLTSVAKETPRFETMQADVPRLLLSSSALSLDGHARVASDAKAGRSAAGGGPERERDHDRGHDHDRGGLFDTWSIQPRREFSAKALRTLLRDVPAGVLRLKGVLRTDEHGWAELQFAGKHGSLRKALAAPATGAAVVAIGLRHRLPVQALHAAFQASLSDAA